MSFIVALTPDRKLSPPGATCKRQKMSRQKSLNTLSSTFRRKMISPPDAEPARAGEQVDARGQPHRQHLQTAAHVNKPARSTVIFGDRGEASFRLGDTCLLAKRKGLLWESFRGARWKFKLQRSRCSTWINASVAHCPGERPRRQRISLAVLGTHPTKVRKTTIFQRERVRRGRNAWNEEDRNASFSTHRHAWATMQTVQMLDEQLNPTLKPLVGSVEPIAIADFVLGKKTCAAAGPSSTRIRRHSCWG